MKRYMSRTKKYYDMRMRALKKLKKSRKPLKVDEWLCEGVKRELERVES